MWRAAAIVFSCLIVLVWGTSVERTSVAHAQQTPSSQQAPVEIFLTQFSYDDTGPGSYNVVISITDPSQVGQIDPRLLDLQTGEDVRFGDLVPVTDAEMSFKLPTDQLQAGRKYKLALRAFQKGTQTYIRRPNTNPSENPLVFASQEFAYNPPAAVPIVFSVDGAKADFPNHALLIAINHSDTTRKLRYEAVVVDNQGGAVGRIERADLVEKNGIITAPLPAAMEQADGPAEYHLTLRLYTADNNRLIGEQKKDFTLPGPPKPNIIERLIAAQETNPWLGWSLAGIALCVFVASAIAKFWRRKPKTLPRPQNLEPVYIRTAQAAAAAAAPVAAPAPIARAAPVAARIVEPPPVRSEAAPIPAAVAPALTPAAAPAPAPAVTGAPMTLLFDDNTAMLLVPLGGESPAEYPLLGAETAIGRSGENDIVIPDTYVSRKHATIARQGDAYVWMDREGVRRPTIINGTTVTAPHALRNGDKIEIGKTMVEFRAVERPADAAPAAPGGQSRA